MTIYKSASYRHKKTVPWHKRCLHGACLLWCCILAGLWPQRSLCQEQPPVYSSESAVRPPAVMPADTQQIAGLLGRADLLQQRAPDSALLLLQAALTESVRSRYAYGAANALLKAGIIYGNRAEYARGLRHFRRALYYSRAAAPGPGNITADVYNNMGLVYYYMGNYSRAVYYYYYAIQEEIRNRHISNIIAEGSRSLVVFYNNITVLLLNIEQYEQAKYYLNLAGKIVRRQQFFNLEPLILVNKGALFVADNEPDSAYASFLLALQSAKRYDHQPALRAAGYGLGEVLLKKDMPAQAIPYLETAIQPHGKANLYYASTVPFYLLGSAWYQMKQYEKAEHYLLLSLQEAEREGTLKELMNIHNKLALVSGSLGKYQAAAAHWQAYSNMKDSLLDMETGQTVNRLEVQYRTAQKDKALAEQQVIIARKNAWIWTIAATLLFLLLMLLAYARHRQRMQEKKIRILEQQKEIRSLKAMMQGEERERMRIARELHDGIGGMLAAIKMNFSALQQRHGNGSADFGDVMHLLDETGREIHETAHNLMPDVLLRHGLPEALRLYCETVNAGNRLQVELQTSGDLQRLDQSFALSLYRIVQELVQNIIKHAHATHALVQVIQRDEVLSILVEDDGSGFDPAQTGGGMGLKNLEYRVYVMQGTLSLQAAPGKGTLACIEFAMDKIKNVFA